MSPETTAQQAMAAEDASVVQADNQFAMDLYVQLDREQPGKNLFLSPPSISLALAMTAGGARGQTRAEMAKALHLNEDLALAQAYYHKLLDQWNAPGKKRAYQLRVANRLWGQKGYPIAPEFLALTRQQYDAEMISLDFVHAEAARQEINQWVENQTSGKITDLIPSGAIDNLTRLVLTNAVYFKGDWVKPFDKTNTQDQDFTVAAGRKVKTPMMQQTTAFGYGEEETLQALEMPYAGRELSMVVLLPKKPDGLPDLEKSLSLARLNSLLSRLRTREVIAQMPKFKLEASFGLKPTLEALGMKLAFSHGADFGGISTQEDLHISAVIHKAFVDVNEEGTEAAAATGVMVGAMAMRQPEPTPVFRADHPFLFLIRDTTTGSILFMGRLVAVHEVSGSL
jgi:serpin B